MFDHVTGESNVDMIGEMKKNEPVSSVFFCCISIFNILKTVEPLRISAKMANRWNLSDADIAKLIKPLTAKSLNASEYDNHTSDEIESESSHNDFDIDIQQMHNIQSI